MAISLLNIHSMLKFSIVIPCFNCSKTIYATLQSCLEQSFRGFEILLIDDCSQEDIKQIFTLFEQQFLNLGISFRYFKFQKNCGVSQARNFGWSNSLGEYVCFLDSDDVWHKEKLTVIDFFTKDLEPVCLFHTYTDDSRYFRTLLEINSTSFILSRKGIFNLILKNISQTSCAVIKRDIEFRFDQTMSHCEDYDLWLRLSLIYPIYFLSHQPLTLLGRPQLSPGGLSSARMKMRKGEITAYFNLCKERNIYYLIYPFLICFSILKHLKSELFIFVNGISKNAKNITDYNKI